MHNRFQPTTLDEAKYFIEQVMLPHNIIEDDIYEYDQQGKPI